MLTNTSEEANQTEDLVMYSTSGQLMTDLSQVTTVVILPYEDDGATGTGLINSFVMIQGSPEQEGYNSDYRDDEGDKTQFDETNSLQFNHAITLASIPVFEKDGTQYLVLHLDLNEINAGSGPYIDLQSLKIFSSDSPDLTGYDDNSSTFSSGDSTLLYDMDSLGDITVRLEDWNSGSGKGDYTFYIPLEGIGGLDGFTTTSSDAFIYVYSKFGDPYEGEGKTDGGFEEWFVRSLESPHINLTKVTGDGIAGELEDGDGLSLLAGTNIVWTYRVENTGTVDLQLDKNEGLFDDNGTVDDFSDDFNPVFLSGDTGGDEILSVGEIWIFEYHGKAVYGDYANTATVTAYHGESPVTASDDSSYTGTFEQAMAGRTQGFWGSRPGVWDGSSTNNASFDKFVGTVLSKAEINEDRNYVLLGDLNGDGQTSDGENTIGVTNDVALAILSAKVSGDARLSMLQQAIATQLNIYNGAVNPGDSPEEAAGYQSMAGDLITEATLWLKTFGLGTKSGVESNLFADGVIDASDYNISKGTLADTQTAAQRTLFWNTAVDVDSTDRNIHATGEDLKNLLDAFNNNKLITSAEGQVAWNDNDASPETIVEPTGVEMNVADAFWAVGHDYISDFKGLVWHG